MLGLFLLPSLLWEPLNNTSVNINEKSTQNLKILEGLFGDTLNLGEDSSKIFKFCGDFSLKTPSGDSGDGFYHLEIRCRWKLRTWRGLHLGQPFLGEMDQGRPRKPW